ncbi:hypothetical protein GCM10027277_54820 [Pseudoduganella ginsengisoli]|uniref:Uncharacterized protein n=1 Tax=Pseudoduganella ginsengisoli TaxID=1462440 RepID=A0A6L6Q591_9BURK|nr:hypothetical protein [Pseudoduganella ginsengisoli]MTW04917.1 hypothetical protein [Pseudoduganella ginsengisoli]
MRSKKYNFRGRQVYIMDLVGELPLSLGKEFVVLLPACNDDELLSSKILAPGLLDKGCAEFCCVGALAEELHDRIDEFIEDQEKFDVVTTYHHEIVEACEYFLFAAAGAQLPLIAMVADHVEIESCLGGLIG